MTIAAFVQKTDNQFISAFGIGLMINSILRFQQYRRITRNESTIKHHEIAEKDERNLMLSEKARSWAFGFYIILTGSVVIVLSFLGIQDSLMQMISCSVCLLVLIYWVCYCILKGKY